MQRRNDALAVRMKIALIATDLLLFVDGEEAPIRDQRDVERVEARRAVRLAFVAICSARVQRTTGDQAAILHAEAIGMSQHQAAVVLRQTIEVSVGDCLERRTRERFAAGTTRAAGLLAVR